MGESARLSPSEQLQQLSAKAPLSRQRAHSSRLPAAGRLCPGEPKGDRGGGRPKSERASALLLLPDTACLSPDPLLRSGWAAKEIPALRVRAAFLRLPPSSLRGSRANPEGAVGHVYITSHPEDASGGRLVPTVAR